MARVSRFHLNKTQTEQITNQFSFVISSLKHEEDRAIFLDEFFTPEEKIMLTKRFALFVFLTQGLETTTIKNLLNMSGETIRVYHHLLPLKTEKFHALLQKLSRKEHTKSFLKRLEKVLDVVATISSTKTNMKSRRKILSGQY